MSAVISEYRTLEKRLLPALRPELTEPEFDALAREVFDFQRRWNAPYRAFCATLPEPRTWREIPAVPQAIFKRYVLSVAPHHVSKIFRTSGTTGEARGAHHFVDTRLYDTAIRRGWARLQRPALPLLILAPAAANAPHSSLAHMLGVLASNGREAGAPNSGSGSGTGVPPVSEGVSPSKIFAGETPDYDRRDACPTTSTPTPPTSPTPARHFVNAVGELDDEAFSAAAQATVLNDQPVALLGTALAFLHVFERLGRRSLTLAPGSFAMETGGYKGSGREIPKAELYAMFGEHLGLAPDDVINEYGMTELSSQCYTRGLARPHLAPPWMRVLVISPETGAEVALGETGVLRLFDLANLGSVIALETPDLAIRREQGFELLGRDPAALPRGCSRAADERMRA